MSETVLVAPTVALRDTFLDGLRQFRAEGLPWWSEAYTGLAERDFGAFVAQKLDEVHHPLPKTQLWAVRDGVFVGRIGLFHRLDEALRHNGGHIGYDTVPSWRRRGGATDMLRLVLPVARDLGLSEVLLTCDADNLGSVWVIEGNGGVLIDSTKLPSGRCKSRYQISLLHLQ